MRIVLDCPTFKLFLRIDLNLSVLKLTYCFLIRVYGITYLRFPNSMVWVVAIAKLNSSNYICAKFTF